MSDVDIWIRSCHSCQLRREKKTRLPIKPSAPVQLFRHFYLDIMHMPKAHGFEYIVLARDDGSSYPEGKPLRKANGKSIAKFIWEHIITRWGSIVAISTDNGTENVNEAVRILMRKSEVQHIRISPYNSQADGVVERGHRTFRENLIRSCGDDPLSWPTMFHHALWAERATIRVSTGYSPFYLAHGYHLLLPTDAYFLTFGWDAMPMSQDDLLVERTRLLARKAQDEAEALKRLQLARFNSAEAWNKRHQHTLQLQDFAPGELVLVRNSIIETDLSRKHKPRWLGPMVVVRRTKGGSYVLAEVSGALSKIRFAATRLSKYHRRDGLTFRVEDFIPSIKLDMLDLLLREEEKNRIVEAGDIVQEAEEVQNEQQHDELGEDDDASDIDDDDAPAVASLLQTVRYKPRALPHEVSAKSTDALMRVSTYTIEALAHRSETHVFAHSSTLPASIRRIWWFVDGALRWFSQIGQGESRGQVTSQTNRSLDAFHAGLTPHDAAYPVQSLVQLQHPLSVNQLLEFFNVDITSSRGPILLSNTFVQTQLASNVRK